MQTYIINGLSLNQPIVVRASNAYAALASFIEGSGREALRDQTRIDLTCTLADDQSRL